MNMRLAAVVGLATASCQSAALAQAGADSDTVEIVVLGSGLALPPGSPAYGSVTIARDRLSEDASGRIENVLRDVAGFQQFRRSDSRSANPSAQGATLRALGGNASSRTLVLLDGVPQADPFFGYIPFSALVPERLSVVRVTRGGGSGAFGAGAVAGTIEMASAGAGELPVVVASAAHGSFDASELSASFTPQLGAGFATLSGRWDLGDGFFTTPAANRGPADARAAYDSWSVGLRAVAPLSDTLEVQARGLLFHDDRTLRFIGADSGSEGQDASIRLVARGSWQVDALAYVQARNFSNVVVSATSFRPVLDQRITPSTGIGGKLEIRPPVGGNHLLRMGVDTRIADGELFEDAISGVSGLVTARRNAGGRTSTTGVFVEDDWTLGNLVLTAGARADRWTITGGFFAEANAAGATTIDSRFAARSGWEGSFRGGALWRVSDALALRAAGYTGFRLPTLNELYRPFTVFPVVTRANEDLVNEQLKGVEAGFDLTPSAGFNFGATVFVNRLDDAIANVTIGNNLRQRQNLDAILARGIELTAVAASGPFALTASYAYSHSKVIGSGASAALDGLTPAQSPRHSASGTAAFRSSGGARVSATLRYTGSQFEDDLETEKLPDALTLDLFAAVPVVAGFSAFARAENVFDAKVITRQQGTSIDLGTPQTFWFGVKWAR